MNLDELNWNVQAGDQVGESEDDQQCGDHFIEKGLECHDGDAHRPTPGKNPYWQGGRKGAGDDSKSGDKGSSGEGQPHERDKSERTERSQDYGQEGGPEKQAKFAVKQFDHYADQMEENNPGMEWTPEKKYELLEMVMRDTAREFSLDSDQLGFTDPSAIHYGPIDNYLSSRQRGRKGREMSRPRQEERQGPGTDVSIPAPHQGGGGILEKTREHTRGPQEASLAVRLIWANDEQAQGRPCEEGEDPKIGKCNPNTSPERSGRKATDLQYRMSDDSKQFKGPPKSGIGITPSKDADRKGRIAKSVKSLFADKGDNPSQTSVSMRHLFGNNPARPGKDGSIQGGQIHSTPEAARAAGDDAKVALEQGGFHNLSDMGGTSHWRKGSTTVTIQTSEQNGKYGNKFRVSGPKKKAPKKSGFFRRG